MQESETNSFPSAVLEETRTRRGADSKDRNKKKRPKKRKIKSKSKGKKNFGKSRIRKGPKKTGGQRRRGGRQSIVFEGENCQFVDFGTVSSSGSGCVDGTKMVLKNK